MECRGARRRRLMVPRNGFEPPTLRGNNRPIYPERGDHAHAERIALSRPTAEPNLHHTKYEGATYYDLRIVCTKCNNAPENCRHLAEDCRSLACVSEGHERPLFDH